MKKFKTLTSAEIKKRVIQNATKEGKAAFMPTSMAIAFVETAVR